MDNKQEVSVRFYTPKASCKVMKPLKVCKVGGARVVRLGATKPKALKISGKVAKIEAKIFLEAFKARKERETALWQKFQEKIATVVNEVREEILLEQFFGYLVKSPTFETKESKKSVHIKVIKSKVFNPVMCEALAGIFLKGDE